MSVTLMVNDERLCNLCETRWVERHDAIISFKLFYAVLLDALDECNAMRDKESLLRRLL